jgi:hypothetical protein
MGLHITTTWLATLLIHPFILLVFWGAENFSDISNAGELLGMIFLTIFSSLFISIPSLLLGQLIMPHASKLIKNTRNLFMFWLLISPIIVVMNYFIIALMITSGELFLDGLAIAIPAIISAPLTILLRYKQFFKTFNELNQNKNETTMV